MLEPDLFLITLYSALAGVLGTGGGGLLAYICPRPGRRAFSMILGFAAGIMLVIIFMELVAEALDLGSNIYVIIGIVIGIGVFLVLDTMLPHYHPVTGDDGRHVRYMNKGYLIASGIALHNLPEGLAIGAGFAVSSRLGFGLVIIIALHNIPEGLSLAMPFNAAGRKEMGLWVSVITGLFMGVGGFIGGLVGNVSPILLSMSLSFAAGAMLYIVCDELIPDAYQTSNDHSPIIGIVIGVVMGLMIISI